MGACLPDHNVRLGHHGTEGHARCDTFCQGYYVRHYAKVLHSEHLSGAAHAGLYLIGHIENSVLFSRFLKLQVEFWRRHNISSLTLDRFYKNGRNLFRRHGGTEEGILHPPHTLSSAIRIGQIVRASVTIGIRDMGNSGYKWIVMLLLDYFTCCK